MAADLPCDEPRYELLPGHKEYYGRSGPKASTVNGHPILDTAGLECKLTPGETYFIQEDENSRESFCVVTFVDTADDAQ